MALLAGAWLLAGRGHEAASALIVLSLLAVPLLAGSLWLALARRFPPRGPLTSRNLIAAAPGASPRLYLCAHYDSKSQSLPLVLRIACGLGLAACLAVLAALLLLGGPGLQTDLLFAASALLALVLAWQTEGDASPGALDNGAAVALLLALAPEAASGGVGLILFGAEELGLLGSLDFARAHPEARGVRFVNLDGLGLAGRLRLFGAQGELGGRVRRAAEAAGVPLKDSPLWPGLLMDHVALSAAGFDALSLGCVGGPSRQIHSAGDRPELVEEEGLREAAAVLLELIATT